MPRKTGKRQISYSFCAVRTIGCLVTPEILTLALIEHDRKTNGGIDAAAQSVINGGGFWREARRMHLPGFHRDRIPEALDFLQANCKDNELCQAPGFAGDIMLLSDTKEPVRKLQELMFHENTLYWLSTKFDPDWFGSRYGSIEDIKDEFLRNLGRNWPKEFPWDAHIAEIYGIYHG